MKEFTLSTAGYKLLLKMLVKASNAKVKEIPYKFADRESGSSKLDSKAILDHVKAILHLYAFKNSKSLGDKQRKANLDAKKKVFIKN